MRVKERFFILEFLIQLYILLRKNISLYVKSFLLKKKIRKFILTSLIFIFPVLVILAFHYGSEVIDSTISIGTCKYIYKNQTFMEKTPK
jgi:hypothetical protein